MSMYEVPFYIVFYTIEIVLALLAITFLPDWINYPLFIGLAILGPWLNYWRYKKLRKKYLKGGLNMKVNELTGKILLSNDFKETENDVYECFLQAVEPLDTGDTEVYYRRLYMYYNYLEWRWSVWYLSGDDKRHLGYCKTVEQLNKLLKKNKIDKEIIIKKED